MNRSTRNNIYDILITSAYVFGLAIIGTFLFAIAKLVYLILWRW